MVWQLHFDPSHSKEKVAKGYLFYEKTLKYFLIYIIIRKSHIHNLK